MNRLILAVAVLTGLALGWMDSRPGWDDAGITAGLLVITTGLLTFLAPRRPWLLALAVGVWIPLNAIIAAQNYTALVALVFPFIGAYGAVGVRKLFKPAVIPPVR